MEPIPAQQNYKTMATVLWIALITAILVTIIDWKIKSDILRLTDAFYRVYPSTMEEQHGAPIRKENSPDNNGRADPPSILRVPMVDTDARLETENAVSKAPANPEDHSELWSKFAPDVETGIQSGAAENSE